MSVKLASGPGGHPEIGDAVYRGNGKELGTISFFYSKVRDDVWAVKIGDDEEDHNIVVIKRVPATDMDGNQVEGYGLVRLNEQFMDNNRRGLGAPSIVIKNNVGPAAHLVVPEEMRANPEPPVIKVTSEETPDAS